MDRQGFPSDNASTKPSKGDWKQEEERLYEDCLQRLRARFQGEGKELFFRSFESAYKQIYYKRKESKSRYWSTASLVILVLATGGSGTVAAASLCSIVTAFLPSLKELGSSALTAFTHSHGSLIWVFLLSLGLLASCLSVEFKRRNYRDTWVRHSTAYYRLNLAMVWFLSGLTEEEDFMKEVLRILESNLISFGDSATSSRGVRTGTEVAD